MNERVSSVNVIFDRIARILTGFFLDSAAGDSDKARLSAVQMLQSYDVSTGAELLLVAQVIAFGFAALDNLSQSFADPDLPLPKILRLRGNANSLNRAAQQCQRVLDHRCPAAVSSPATHPTATAVPAPEPLPAAGHIEAVMRTISAMLAQPGGTDTAARSPPVAPVLQTAPNPAAPVTLLQRRAAKMDARARRHREITLRHAERAALALAG